MNYLPSILLGFSLLSAPTAAIAQSNYNFYYGNLHSHTGYSDGSVDSASSGVSTPYQAYQYAKASLHFDLLGVSEHNHSTAGMNLSNYHRGVQQADSANEDSSFVALFGMEWGTISSGGHVLVYGIDSLLNWEQGNYDIFVGKGVYTQLWGRINNRPGAFGMLCHPKNTDFYNIRNASFSPSADEAIVGTAFRSGPAFSTNTTYTHQSSSSFESYYKGLLSKGYHVGPTYDHDNHNTTFGRTTEGRLVAIAPALTRADLMHAFRNRAFFASDDWNTEVMLTVNNDNIMGAIINDEAAPVVQVTLADLDGENYNSFQLLKGRPRDGQTPVVVTTATSGAMALAFTDTTLALGDSAYYFASITQADGDRIITSPIWYTRGTFISSAPDGEHVEPALLVWPSPVSSSARFVTIAAPEAGDITILDALGSVVKKETIPAAGAAISIEGLAPGLYFIKHNSLTKSIPACRLIIY